MKKGRRATQTPHSNVHALRGSRLVLCQCYTLAFSSRESHHPDEMTEETIRSHHVARHLTSSLGQRKIIEGHPKARWLAIWLR
jgi:hypothetical protein